MADISKKIQPLEVVSHQDYELFDYFPDNLRLLREDLGFSQKQLAQCLGVTRAVIRKMESGENTNRRNDFVIKFSILAGVDAFDLQHTKLSGIDPICQISIWFQYALTAREKVNFYGMFRNKIIAEAMQGRFNTKQKAVKIKTSDNI